MLALLASRGRVVLDKPMNLWLEAALAELGPIVEPLGADVAIESCRLPGNFHRDPADRIIVATSRILGLPLATDDLRILRSRLVQPWRP